MFKDTFSDKRFMKNRVVLHELLTDRQTDKHTNTGHYIISLAKVINIKTTAAAAAAATDDDDDDDDDDGHDGD